MRSAGAFFLLVMACLMVISLLSFDGVGAQSTSKTRKDDAGSFSIFSGLSGNSFVPKCRHSMIYSRVLKKCVKR
jgi:hypothetical protein